uniref:DB domain-containing protein n=1 Tax=Panagrellus redivivus TaxID=6233 RepID=A0A7E4VCX0_PANRE
MLSSSVLHAPLSDETGYRIFAGDQKKKNPTSPSPLVMAVMADECSKPTGSGFLSSFQVTMIYRLFLATCLVGAVFSQNEVSEFENPTDCGNKANDWKPCIERKIADQVFGACCERFVPPECRGLCIYETHPIEARVILMHTIQPSRCRLYKYLAGVVHCAAQTHDNTECCTDMGVDEAGPTCANLCRPQQNPRTFWGARSLRKDLVQCLAKWDQIMTCNLSGLRARKIIKDPSASSA